MNILLTSPDLEFDALLADLLSNRDSLKDKNASTNNDVYDKNMDSFGSWYEAD